MIFVGEHRIFLGKEGEGQGTCRVRWWKPEMVIIKVEILWIILDLALSLVVTSFGAFRAKSWINWDGFGMWWEIHMALFQWVMCNKVDIILIYLKGPPWHVLHRGCKSDRPAQEFPAKILSCGTWEGQPLWWFPEPNSQKPALPKAYLGLGKNMENWGSWFIKFDAKSRALKDIVLKTTVPDD